MSLRVGSVWCGLTTIVLATAPGLGGPGLGAQSPSTARPTWLEATAGTALESYVRLLTLDSARATYPVGERAFSPRELERITRAAGTRHPWAARFTSADTVSRGARVQFLRPLAQAIVNTTFPFGMNQGPIWAGRGLTTATQLGLVAEAGPLTVRLEPVAFRAQNAAFPLFPNGLTGDARLRDPIEPDHIDLPQRFGWRAYERLDLGNSEVRLDVVGLAVGVSNANEVWGPSITHPLILSANAPGFLHGFVGTGRPIGLPFGIARINARLEVGRIEESAESPAGDSLRHRGMSGAVFSILPGGPLDGIEVGGTRFYHYQWTGRLSSHDLLFPLTDFFFKQGHEQIDDPSSPGYVAAFQLASLFARWAFPQAGLEVYGEYLRHDAAADARDLLLEPDHQAAFTVGFQRLCRASATRWTVIRAEVVDARTTALNRVRPQARLYQHGQLVQGHTSRGEVLGSVAVLGGGGAVLGWDRYTPAGKTTVELHRILHVVPLGEGSPVNHTDVQYVARMDHTAFRRGVDLMYGGGVVYELNRNFQRDAVNVLLSVGARWGRQQR